MKLSSVLLGDWADLFQDSRIEDAASSARSAASTANRNHAQLTHLVEVAEKRLQELARENVLLGVLLAGLLKHLAKSDAAAAQALLDEAGRVCTRESAFSAATAQLAPAGQDPALHLHQTPGHRSQVRTETIAGSRGEKTGAGPHEKAAPGGPDAAFVRGERRA